MRRVLVIGSPGAGKTTLARRLALAWQLPVIHLDREYFGPGWSMPGRDEWRLRVAELAARPSWVMDGNYASTFDIRVKRATMVVWLDTPRWKCLLGVSWRVISSFGSGRSDLGPDCIEGFDRSFTRWIWDYPNKMRPLTERMLSRLRPDQQAVTVSTRAEADALEHRFVRMAEAA